MRTILAAALALAGCEPGAPDEVAGNGDRIECRLGGAAAFEPLCTVERTAGEAGMILTIRKPDGGFRRLRVAPDGRGVAAADGAEEARVTILDAATILVEIGGDAYRLPATVRVP